MHLMGATCYTFVLTACAVPSLSLPTKVRGRQSGIPMSVLPYGLRDRELLGIGGALEKVMK
jgi:hypothetical protein